MDWSPNKTATLLDGYKNGLPYAEIAELVNCTRNAICGKVHRMRLADKPEFLDERMKNGAGENHRNAVLGWAARVRNGTVMRRSPRAKVVAQPMPILPFLGIPFKELRANSCRYPHGERHYLFCGQPKAEESSYCDFHKILCCSRKSGLGTWIPIGRAASRVVSNLAPVDASG